MRWSKVCALFAATCGSPYLNVPAASVGQALHVLDCYHIASHLNQALDQVRRDESGRLRSQHHTQAAHLKNMRWKLLRRHSRVTVEGPERNWAGCCAPNW
ncbi:MAG: transposase, partial [Limisphaerales bacterium]